MRNVQLMKKYIYNIRTLSVNIKFICTSFRNRQNSKYKWIWYLTTMYVYCVYPAMSKKSENLSDLNKKDRNKRHSSPFINVKGVFFVVRVTLVPVSYLSAPSAVHSYRVPGKFIRLVRIKQKFIRIAYLYSKCTDCRINIYNIFRVYHIRIIAQKKLVHTTWNRQIPQ
jgi:hypothetical protein